MAPMLMLVGCCGACNFDLAPRRPREDARRSEKVMRLLSQLKAEYLTCCFFANKKANLLVQLCVIGPQPPLLENTSGTKELCSTSRTL